MHSKANFIAAAAAILAIATPLALSATVPAPLAVSPALVTAPSVEKEVASPSHEVNRASDGLFYVFANVDGKPMRFLVDTGASVVVLTADDARTLGFTATDGYRGSVQTAAGAASMAWTTLGHIQIGARRAHRVRAAVVREGLKVSLLGQNALTMLGSLTISGDRLSFR